MSRLIGVMYQNVIRYPFLCSLRNDLYGAYATLHALVLFMDEYQELGSVPLKLSSVPFPAVVVRKVVSNQDQLVVVSLRSHC